METEMAILKMEMAKKQMAMEPPMKQPVTVFSLTNRPDRQPVRHQHQLIAGHRQPIRPANHLKKVN